MITLQRNNTNINKKTLITVVSGGSSMLNRETVVWVIVVFSWLNTDIRLDYFSL